jgi:hypothetical protein
VAAMVRVEAQEAASFALVAKNFAIEEVDRGRLVQVTAIDHATDGQEYQRIFQNHQNFLATFSIVFFCFCFEFSHLQIKHQILWALDKA